MKRASLMMAAVAVACTSTADSSAVPEAVRTDSAGVEIVFNSADGASLPEFVTLGSDPTLRLGSLDGQPEEQFGEVAGVLPLPDGGVAVLDGQAADVRLFDSEGGYRGTLGSKGQGPGEFQSPIDLGLLPGDTLAVYDSGPRRVTRFGLDGILGRITTLEETRARIVAASFLADGRVIGQSRWLSPSGAPLPGAEPTFVRDTAVLTLFASDGSVADTIDVVPGRETVTSIQRNENSISVFRRTSAFGRANLFATHPDGVWSSANDRFELRLYDVESGRLTRIVRAPGLERPVREELAQAIYDRALAEAETADDRRRIESWFAASPRPETQPAYDLLVVDDQARLWVREWSGRGSGTRWWVFARSGELLGRVDVPSRFTISAVRCAVVWGVEQGEFDVSYVSRYPVRGLDGCEQTSP